MEFSDWITLACIIFISFTAGNIYNDIINQEIIEGLQTQSNETIEKQKEMQEQMKYDYEEKMLEIAINDTAAKDYVLKYTKANIFITFETKNEVQYLMSQNSYNIVDVVTHSSRINISENEIFSR